MAAEEELDHPMGIFDEIEVMAEMDALERCICETERIIFQDVTRIADSKSLCGMAEMREREGKMLADESDVIMAGISERMQVCSCVHLFLCGASEKCMK